MSCALQRNSFIADSGELRSILYPGELKHEELSTDYDYDNRWAWDDESDKKDDTRSVKSSASVLVRPPNSWLSECLHAVSPPVGDVQVFARDRYLAIYKCKLDCDRSGSSSAELRLAAPSSLSGLAVNEKITAIALVPMISQQKTNAGSIDWTAICVGFNSGTLRVYTDTGQLVFHQKLSDDSVISIKCSTFYSPVDDGKRVLSSDHEQMDEIMVVFKSKICCIEGFAFYQTVRSARNHLAHLPKGHDAVQHVMDIGITLAYKIWQFTRDEPSSVTDIENAGMHSTNIYDMFVGQSIRGTHGGIPRNTALSKTLLTASDNPYLGFYATHEGDSQASLSEVAHAVVGAVKSFIPLFGRKDESLNKPDNQPLPIKPRLGLYDQNREGLKIALSPDKWFAAVSDELGRVVLVDIRSKLVVRMWKGYREAECGWIRVLEDSTNALSRKCLLLVIYAPKRGIVEIWKCVKGSRIAAFNVGKNCRLVYNYYDVFGQNHLVKRDSLNSASGCFLFDRTNLTLSNFEIPFDALRYCIETKNSHITRTVAECLFQHLHNPSRKYEDDTMDYASKLLVQSCARVMQLSTFYEKLQELHENSCQSSPSDFLKNPPRDIEALSQSLSWKVSEVAKCISLFGLRESVGVTKTSTDSPVPSFQSFMASFAIEQTALSKNAEGHFLIDDVPVDIKWESSKGLAENFYELASFIFSPVFSSDIGDVFKLYDRSVIKPNCMLRLLYLMWLSPKQSHADDYENWEKFSFAVKTISLQLGEVPEEDSMLSSSWRAICGLEIGSKNLPAALIGAYVTKAITAEMNIQKLVSQPDEDKGNMWDDEWETLSLDEERLNLLLKQLEDTFLLGLLLKSDKQQNDDLSLSCLLKGNSGIVSELVARWAVKAGIPSQSLVAFCEHDSDSDEGDCMKDDIHEADEVLNGPESLLDEETVKDLLSHVRRCFPHSLDPQVLLANCCWEAMSHWDKNPSLANADFLTQSLSYLNSVNSSVLKHNIACLLWKTYVVKKFETLCLLMEKMSKVPKERICQKDLGMSEECLEPFIQFAHQLLEVIVQNIRAAEFEGPPIFTVDEWWRNQPANGSRQPLVLLAVGLKLSNSSLVLEHTHLALVILFLIVFQLKSQKPLSLYPSFVRQSLFKELHSSSFEVPLGDQAINDLRTKFLLCLVSSLAESIPSSSGSDDIGPSQHSLYSTAVQWFGHVLVLTREWELNVDLIRRRFVCELYRHSCDSLAVELQNSVVDRPNLATLLLPIAAHRVLSLLTSGKIKASLPPNVAIWVQSMENNDSLAVAETESTLILLQQILGDMDDDHVQFKTVLALIDAVKS
ncbi:Rab3 GTPase-activating protein regulatory subunit [Halotydeus destructor]|nr:Rab3 GTPase-activating protein regulatory subunit [Halotydeus destructor]